MQINPLYCQWDTESTLLIFSDNVFGNFIYYSHLLPVMVVVLFSVILLLQDKNNRTVHAFAVMSTAFTLWSLSDLVLWATANPDHTMFFWSIIIHFELLVYISCLYFIYYYLFHRPPRLRYEAALLIFYIPIILFAHTNLNLLAFDYTNCWREAVEGPLVLYVYIFETVIAAWILGLGLKEIFAKKSTLEKSKKEVFFVTLGTSLFLLSFSFGNIIGTLEVDWELGQYGLFAIPIFVGLLTYLITNYRRISVKLIGTEILVVSILVLIISILFVRTIDSVRAITVVTIVIVAGLGFTLIKSVRREVDQRQRIEKLAKDLRKANERFKVLDKMKSEFVSIASHQLRSPLTSIRGYTSMLLEGSYGPIPLKAQEALERIAESSKYMVESVEDYLNVSRIESGNMKYEMTDFNFKDQVSNVVDELRSPAVKRGLLLTFRSDITAIGIVNADIGKVRQALHNLINNSIKYTLHGTIMVSVTEDQKKQRIFATISDTGIGMNEETLNALFVKFSRAKGANSVNTSGTGLGLYVAKQMVEHMGGTITAHSEGEGMGSVFTLELPLLQ